MKSRIITLALATGLLVLALGATAQAQLAGMDNIGSAGTAEYGGHIPGSDDEIEPRGPGATQPDDNQPDDAQPDDPANPGGDGPAGPVRPGDGLGPVTPDEGQTPVQPRGGDRSGDGFRGVGDRVSGFNDIKPAIDVFAPYWDGPLKQLECAYYNSLIQAGVRDFERAAVEGNHELANLIWSAIRSLADHALKRGCIVVDFPDDV